MLGEKKELGRFSVGSANAAIATPISGAILHLRVGIELLHATVPCG